MPRQALIVEDEPDTGHLLSENLRRWGFEPTVLAEGRRVVPWVRLHFPELVLLDLMLPDVDGYDICQELKLDRQTNRVPIIVVTVRDQQVDRVRGLQVGANAYLTKPFGVDQLHEAIQEVLAWRAELERHGTAGEVHFHLRSEARCLEQLNQMLGSLFRFSGLPSSHIKQLITAVRELGTNAIEWGHRRQVDRIVTVTYRIDSDKVTVVIRDTGPGFNPHRLPHAATADNPLGHLDVREALGLREGGFGILMARGLVDDLQYNETGNEVRLVKHFAPTTQTSQRADNDGSVDSRPNS
jgi:CheY-like chemotaxis protein/anti-sigma regulatory factor (Ser/Thr protein kinase)